MKILLVHPNELVDYHLERLIVESLQTLKHEVTTIKYRGTDPQSLIEQLEEKSSLVDFTLVLKGELLTIEHYRAIRSFSGLWYVDHPKNNKIPEWLKIGCSNVDYMFTTSYGLIEELKKYNVNCHWIVEGAYIPFLHPVEKEKVYDLSFFGTLVAETNNGDVYGSRIDFLKTIDKKFDLHIFGSDSDRHSFNNTHACVWNENFAEEIARTKIVLGYNSTNGIPFYWSNRTYTTLACKGFLITPYVPGIEKVFENHKELVWFYSIEEAEELIDYYLDRPEQRKEIAETGFLKVQAHFSTIQQVQKIINIFNERVKLFKCKQSVLFITDDGYVGCTKATEHWCSLLRQNGVRADHLIANQRVVPSVCKKYKYVILNGYSGKYDMIIEEGIRPIIVWHSSILQTQLENEVGAVKKIRSLCEQNKIETVLCCNESALKLFKKAYWLPDFCCFIPIPSKEQMVDKDKYNMCALGPDKTRKNLFTVLAAHSNLSNKHVLHINVSDEFFKKYIEGVFDTSCIVNHGWLKEDKYYALIEQCDVGFQVSVAESYNFVAAEHLLLKTPIICSQSVPAVDIEDLKVQNHENTGELLAKVDLIKRTTKEQLQKWFTEFETKNEVRKEKAKQQLFHHVLKIRQPPKVSTKRPPLSIVYHGRNDNYGGDFKRRFAWSLRTVSRAFQGLNPEIIFVNWNTLPKSSSLFDEALIRPYANGIKVYEVSDSIHKELSTKHNFKGVYLEWYAKNFGLRRASGEYILQLNADNIIIDTITQEHLPPPDVTYIGTRVETDISVLGHLPENLTKEVLETLKKRVQPAEIDRPHFVGGSCGEFLLSHRDNWYKICGNVEVADRYCIDNVTATHLRMISHLEEFVFPIYHITHPSALGSWPGFKFDLGYSGPKWGLADLNIIPRIIGE